MNTEKFTPGPWKVYYPWLNKRITVILDNKEDFYVATIDEKNSMPVQANANLIAAAPLMYHALKNGLRQMAFLIDQIERYEEQPEMDDVYTVQGEMKIALKKANPEI